MTQRNCRKKKSTKLRKREENNKDSNYQNISESETQNIPSIPPSTELTDTYCILENSDTYAPIQVSKS